MNYLIISAGLRNHLSLHRFPEYLEELWGYCFHRLVHTTTLRLYQHSIRLQRLCKIYSVFYFVSFLAKSFINPNRPYLTTVITTGKTCSISSIQSLGFRTFSSNHELTNNIMSSGILL